MVIVIEPAIGFEQITALSTAKALTPTAGAVKAEIQVEGGAVRFRPDGTAPTTSVGWRLENSDEIETPIGQNLVNCKFIAVDGNPVLNVIYT